MSKETCPAANVGLIMQIRKAKRAQHHTGIRMGTARSTFAIAQTALKFCKTADPGGGPHHQKPDCRHILRMTAPPGISLQPASPTAGAIENSSTNARLLTSWVKVSPQPVALPRAYTSHNLNCSTGSQPATGKPYRGRKFHFGATRDCSPWMQPAAGSPTAGAHFAWPLHAGAACDRQALPRAQE